MGWFTLGITVEETGQSPGFISPAVGISVHVDTTNTDWWHCMSILMFISTALNTAFGSLYCDEVMVSPVKVVPLLAAANLLQLVSTICNPH